MVDSTLGGGGERVTTLGEDLHEVVSEVTTSEFKTLNGVGKSITLIDGHSVRDTITRVHDDTGGTTRGVQGKHGLDPGSHCQFECDDVTSRTVNGRSKKNSRWLDGFEVNFLLCAVVHNLTLHYGSTLTLNC